MLAQASRHAAMRSVLEGAISSCDLELLRSVCVSTSVQCKDANGDRVVKVCVL